MLQIASMLGECGQESEAQDYFGLITSKCCRDNLQSHHDKGLFQSTSLNDKMLGRQKKKKNSCKGIDNVKA